MRLLFGFFIIMPILEMWLLIEVGSVIGALPTIAMVLLTAVIGVTLLRTQGLYTLLRAQQRLRSGELPAKEMLEGIVLAVGGALLLTPGFITDAVGFCCLVPHLRRKLIDAMLRRGMMQMSGGRPRHDGADHDRERGNVTIEGDYKKEE